ncbi:hypothetical protein CEUSTIGMA_g3480.t1 [Chlamydomonas eustigma]|uniref:Uncharacterized protein n=1 Tax=Chlamydomonas eustigma TaxID=1157962 RepID=A0A250WYX1_9CHLO|nr:hypothetical protein CEUSTIGMA_g3480.t1 [Chlamydomonas eustigma]|eukprot:GAX76037.1 hypothetical protein CEUSTIGMA_g3480.t1 [Chlamydomonas eustigma]
MAPKSKSPGPPPNERVIPTTTPASAVASGSSEPPAVSLASAGNVVVPGQTSKSANHRPADHLPIMEGLLVVGAIPLFLVPNTLNLVTYHSPHGMSCCQTI